ncbi:prolipoprotein diacylglyceryl transferase [Acutalibacter sp. LFL-21]|uniref:prolipoprotein diacylglyceryl transferase n=1 Tax=Acutalibacter sp. LFL-21 TaxID=2983399 RepID=UPI0021D66437|nr:prolipoprotein diacylglyceryl transferase [Acutalibacter sp. LFL-21]MCU7653067.1 prolipoprotein diacylglyceryl transferase [Acutalibacter sp. LFL-21]
MTYNVTFPHLGLEFNINPVAFSIGSFHVYWYGIIIAAGFLLALIYASFSCKKMNIDINRLFDVVIVGLIAGVIFARLFYVVFYPGDKYWKNPLEIFQIHDGGLAIYGGIIGAVVFGSLMAKLRKLKVTAVLDIAALGFLIGQCVGRWGNFINQEAFGSATELPWGMHSENTAAVVDGNVHPCFLYESLLCLLGFVLLHFFTRRFRRYDGQTFLLYIVWYGACRFFIEGLRTDSLIIPGTGLRVSQVIAAACVVAGIILLVLFRHRTSLTGCGDRRVMEAVGLVESTALPEDETPSTIFGDLPPEEIQEIFHGHPAWEKGEQAAKKAEEEEVNDPEPAADGPAGAEAEKEEEETE